MALNSNQSSGVIPRQRWVNEPWTLIGCCGKQKPFYLTQLGRKTVFVGHSNQSPRSFHFSRALKELKAVLCGCYWQQSF